MQRLPRLTIQPGWGAHGQGRSDTWVRRSAFWLLGCAVAGAAIWGARALSQSQVLLLLAAALLISVIALGVIAYLHVAQADAFSPLALCALLYFTSFALGGLYYYFGRWPNGNPPFDQSDIPPAIALGALSLVMLALGYASNPLRSALRVVPQLPREVPAPRRTAVVVTLLVIGWLARVYEIQGGRYFYYAASDTLPTATGSSAIVNLFATLPLLATAYVGAQYYFARRQGEFYRTLQVQYFALVAIELAFSAPRGVRLLIIQIVLMAIILRYYGLGRRPSFVRVIAVTLVAVGVVFPLATNFRTAGGEVGYQRNLGQSAQSAVETLVRQSPLEALENGGDTTLERFGGGVTSVAAVLHYGPEPLGQRRGETLSWLLTSFAPRAVVPNKPEPNAFNLKFGHTFGIVPSTAQSYISVPQAAEMYINYRLVGVIFGLFCIGALYRVLGDYLGGRRTEPGALAVYAVMAMVLINSQETLVASGIPGMIKLIGVLALGLFVGARVAGRMTRESDAPA